MYTDPSGYLLQGGMSLSEATYTANWITLGNESSDMGFADIYPNMSMDGMAAGCGFGMISGNGWSPNWKVSVGKYQDTNSGKWLYKIGDRVYGYNWRQTNVWSYNPNSEGSLGWELYCINKKVYYSLLVEGEVASGGGYVLSHANYWLGLSTTFLAGGRGFGMTLDNFKSLQATSDYYKWGLSYSKEIAKTSNWIKGLKIGGVVTSGVSLMLTYNDWKAGEISDGKFGLDAGMTLYSHVPVIGWAAGLQYYIIDNTIGFENFMNIQINLANEQANMINNGNWGAAMWQFGRSIR